MYGYLIHNPESKRTDHHVEPALQFRVFAETESLPNDVVVKRAVNRANSSDVHYSI